jgi:citronellol/citronellal dehydrogenase
MSLKSKTLFITGASRGIGKAIALRAAKDGANIVVLGKTKDPHPKLEGTILSAAKEIEQAGGQALAIQCDVRFEDQIHAAVDAAIKKFGGIDILVNNAGMLQLSGTLETSMKRFDLMWGVNVRGSFACSQMCIPHLKKSDNPHILNISPPLDMDKKWFTNFLPYTLSKYGMSQCVLGMAEEFKDEGIAVNALWPKTTIATAAVMNVLGGQAMADKSRTPKIVGDAAYEIFIQNSKECTGNFFLDEDILIKKGVTDFTPYAVKPGEALQPDLFVN